MKSPKQAQDKILIAQNKRAYFDYSILDTYEFGIVLTGSETKAIRLRRVSIRKSYVRVIGSDLYVINMEIGHYEHSNLFSSFETTRMRKLLAHRHEIDYLRSVLETKRVTLIPVEVYFKKNKIKLKVALCRGKRIYEKKRAIMERDLEREAKRELDSIKQRKKI